MDQSPILSLKKAVDNSKHRLQVERDRQRKKKEEKKIIKKIILKFNLIQD